MNKTATAALGMSALLTAGCAIPVPLQVASWALDGISYVVTEKSVTDHGISAVAQKDCAVWRGVAKGEFCRNWRDDGGTLVADAAKPPEPAARSVVAPVSALAARSDIPPLETALDDGRPGPGNMANVVTAAGRPSRPSPSARVSRLRNQAVAPAVARPAAPRQTVSVAGGAAVPKKPVNVRRARGAEPAAGVYFVIGSFRNYANARRMTGRHGAFLPVVLAANLGGAPVYRVVAGPAAPGREKALHRLLTQSGISDTWAIRVRPGDWSVAHAVIERKRRARTGPELAGVAH